MKTEKIKIEKLSEVELSGIYERYCAILPERPGRLQALRSACYEDGKMVFEIKVDRSLIMLGDITPAIRIDSFSRFKKAINKGYIEVTSLSKKAEAEDEHIASL